MTAGEINRRKFLSIGGAASFGLSLSSRSIRSQEKPLRIGVIGTGARGSWLLRLLLHMPNLQIPALCDIDIRNLGKAQDRVVKDGHPKPEGYSRGPEDFQRMLSREDMDAVFIAAPWDWHTPMAVCAMKSGKYAAVEVPAALSIEECWDLVNTYEETGMPCMMLENASFWGRNLALLNMIRLGMLGEIVHCHCAHCHDCIDHWYFSPQGDMRWPARFLLNYNRDQYPTHSLGPVISWMDIGCGDYYDTISSTATRGISINNYFRKKFGPDHPNAKRKFKQGDIVTSTIKTKKGNTIILNNDMQLPRPYDDRWTIQGTEGIYNQQRDAIYLAGRSPEYHTWEPFPPYVEKYENAYRYDVKSVGDKYGHGGVDYLTVKKFTEAVRDKTPVPIDVYDSVAMSCVVPLSGISIGKGSIPIKVPDFTRGKWRTKKPSFALDMM